LYFNKHSVNSIEFWDCLSNENWPLHTSVDKDIKKFNLTPLYPCKTLWSFSKKEECDNKIKNWQMTFQISNFKGKHFLDLLDNELCSIKPLVYKGSP